MAARTSRNVGSPTLAVIRRTWRFLPSLITIYSHAVGTDSRWRTGGTRSHSPSGVSISRACAGAATRFMQTAFIATAICWPPPWRGWPPII